MSLIAKDPNDEMRRIVKIGNDFYFHDPSDRQITTVLSTTTVCRTLLNWGLDPDKIADIVGFSEDKDDKNERGVDW